MDFARCKRIELGMQPFVVVVVDSLADLPGSIFEVSQGAEINACVLQRSPESLGKHVVCPLAWISSMST
jgi:hypothetical protein